ncbi:MAG TPA: LCP family protein [Actinomycetes bacterium]|nr:LCP family protein [Actinomycetes bacterium]
MPKPANRRHATRARHAAPRARWRRVLTGFLVVVLLILGAGSVTAFVAYQKLNGNINHLDVSNLIGPEKERPQKVAEDPKAENILVMGSDKRSGKNAANVAGARSDTTIVLHLAADRKSATLVSIPRDSMVPIPSCTKQDGTEVPAQTIAMFNSAFSEAGPACTIKTVEKLTKIRIDHYIVVDFSGFKNMIDALGGVRVCLPYAVNDPQSHLNLAAGTHTVKGQQALAYVRTRHGIGNGSDLSRIDRQQAFISSMVKKVKSTGVLLRPDKLYNFLSAATSSLTTDFGSLKSMAGLAQDVKSLPTKDVTFLTIPNEPWTQDPNRVQWKKSAGPVWRSLRFDQPLPGKGPAPTSTASATPSGPPLVTPPERVSVQVLNGSGVKGAASRLAEQLSAVGFNVVGVGDASHTGYTTTTVLHDPAYDESGRTLGAAVPGSTVTADASLGSTLQVIVGTDDPTAVAVKVSGSTSSPEPTETLQTRQASDSICS